MSNKPKSLMLTVPEKPLTVNRAWRGRRFKTPMYEKFWNSVSAWLWKRRPPKLPKEGALFAHYKFYVSNMGSDVDNCVKVFQDPLFEWLEMNNKDIDDKRIRFFIAEKIKVRKGDEKIEWYVNGEPDYLIPYLENLIAEIKAERSET